jgi:hypothetical protein
MGRNTTYKLVKDVEKINLNGKGLQKIVNKERTFDQYGIYTKEYMSAYQIDDLMEDWKDFNEQDIGVEILQSGKRIYEKNTEQRKIDAVDLREIELVAEADRLNQEN